MADQYTDDRDEDLAELMREFVRTSVPQDFESLPVPGDIVAEKFKIESLIGRGGMGAVFSARHLITGKQFAIKWLLPKLSDRPDAVQRFLREAQVGGQVEHANVVEVYDVGQEGSSYFMVMELIRGETLAERLRRLGRCDYTDACRLLIPVMRGLDAVHRAGVIHRDLKPQNIIVATSPEGDEQPMVLDFGISKVLPLSGHMTPSDTRSGMMVMVGTPCYMAPEQLRSRVVDARADVYALGVILYELLGGSVPYSADNYPDLMRKVLDGTPQPLTRLAPGTPRELASIVRKAMACEADDRYASVESLARALEPFASGMCFEQGWSKASSSQSLRALALSGHVGASARLRFPRWLLASAALTSGLLVALVGWRYLAPASQAQDTTLHMAIATGQDSFDNYTDSQRGAGSSTFEAATQADSTFMTEAEGASVDAGMQLSAAGRASPETLSKPLQAAAAASSVPAAPSPRAAYKAPTPSKRRPPQQPTAPAAPQPLKREPHFVAPKVPLDEI